MSPHPPLNSTHQSHRNLDRGFGLLHSPVCLPKLISFASQRTEHLSRPLGDSSMTYNLVYTTCAHLVPNRLTKNYTSESQKFSMIMPIEKSHYFNYLSIISDYNKRIMFLRYQLLKVPRPCLQHIYSHFQIQKGNAL